MSSPQLLSDAGGTIIDATSGSRAGRSARDASVRWVHYILPCVLGVTVLICAADFSRHPVDFPIYHRIATQIWHGHYELYPETVYDAGVAAPAHGFRYAPVVAFLFVPLAWLSLEHAALLFFGLKVMAVIYVGTVVTRQVAEGTRSPVMLIALACVGGYVAEEFRFGNVHFFVVALMVFAFDAVASGAVVAPAAAIAVAVATKLTPIALLGYFLLRRRFAVCVATLAMLVVLAFLPAAIVGIRANNRLLEGFGRYAVEKIDEGDNYSLRGVLMRHVAPARPDTSPTPAAWSARTVSLIWLSVVLVGGLVVGFLLRQAPSGAIPAVLDLSIVLTVILLASPHTQRRYFVALYVPMVVLVALAARKGHHTDRRFVEVGLAITIATSTILPLVFAGRRLALWYEAGSPYFFGTFALFIILIVLRLRLQKPRLPNQAELFTVD
jgi:alpha-1,2-mannosyltransferase